VINASHAHFFFCLVTIPSCMEYLTPAARRNKKWVSNVHALLLGEESWGENEDGYRDARAVKGISRSSD
jgi:hypothetical protein